jgi:hypothetical protein
MEILPENQYPAPYIHEAIRLVAEKRQMYDFSNGKAQMIEVYIAQLEVDWLNEVTPAGRA